MNGQHRYDMRFTRYNRNNSRLSRYNRNDSLLNQLQYIIFEQINASLQAFNGYDYYNVRGGGYFQEHYDGYNDEYYDGYNDEYYDGYCDDYRGEYYNAPRPKHKRRKKSKQLVAMPLPQPTAVKPAKPTAQVGTNNPTKKVLQRMGYQNGNALHKSGTGTMVPLSTGLQTGRKGVQIVEILEKGETSASNNQLNSKRKQETEIYKVNTEMKSKRTTQYQKENQMVPTTNSVKPLLLPQLESKTIQMKGMPKKNNDHTKHSSRDSSNKDELQKIALEFQQEIELLQLRIEAEASLYGDPNEHSLTVAKVFLTNNQQITEQTYEFIRTELVGWIGKYQHQQLDTPIFYSMSNNETHITIVCENFFAYDCLKKCITEIAQLRTLAPSTPSIMRMPHLTKLLYCYDANYSGIIQDPCLFLTQIKLHRLVFEVDRWIVVSHNVCTTKLETHFTFLLDEPSALALNYHYNNKLFICMQKVEFTLRGSMPAKKQEQI